MLWNASATKGHAVEVGDGQRETVSDFLIKLSSRHPQTPKSILDHPHIDLKARTS
jgi:hypothetical protein